MSSVGQPTGDLGKDACIFLGKWSSLNRLNRSIGQGLESLLHQRSRPRALERRTGSGQLCLRRFGSTPNRLYAFVSTAVLVVRGEPTKGRNDRVLLSVTQIVARLSRPRRFPERAQEVVAQLKRDPEWRCPGAKRRELTRVAIAEQPSERRWPLGRVASCLESVHSLDVRVRHQIELLPRKDLLLDFHEEAEGFISPPLGKRRAEEELPTEGRGEVASQDSEACAQMFVFVAPLKGVMDGWTAATLVVPVHPIIVNEQVALQELQRAACFQGLLDVLFTSRRSKRSGRDDRAKALSTTHRQISNLAYELVRVLGEAFCLLEFGREEPMQHLVHLLANPAHPRFEVGLALRHGERFPMASYVHGTLLPSKRPMSADISQRKADHLDLCATDEVAFKQQTTLLECVRLVHQSLPEAAFDDVDLRVRLLGKELRAPLVIAAMTGGHERAAEVNRTLAVIANDLGYGFGLGSQRAMQKRPETAWTYQVREVAPEVLLLGNVGVVQARDLPTEQIAKMLGEVGADALCVHMNPAMELVQPEGDRNFGGGLETFRRLWAELDLPVIAKETGNGISREVAGQLHSLGIRHADTSGAGGTSWVGVETLRAENEARALGQALWDWGVPTAASVHYCVGAGLTTIATGGIRNGMDVARAIALGARCSGIARPVFQAFIQGGEAGARAFLESVERELRSVMLLCGAKTIEELQRAPRVITGELSNWMR